MDKGPVHIVCLDAPSPPDYGGVYDLYYKIPALAALGYQVNLHYFHYKKNRGAQGLEKYCTAIFKYPRKPFLSGLFSNTPFIVRSRINAQLIERINADRAPVILEGIHCTGLLPHIKKDERNIVVRIHNDETVYYRQIAGSEKNLFKKIYLKLESRLLKRYQKSLPLPLHYCFVSEVDQQYFKKEYGLTNTSFIPPFVPWQSIEGKVGSGEYCLYQGNLSISENEEAVVWLLENVFQNLDLPIIIAGKDPCKRLQDRIKANKNASLITNPTASQLEHLIQDAQVHLLPSFNKTGVKLKLLHALFNGRFCITNFQGVEGSGITNGVLLAETPEAFQLLVQEYFCKPFTVSDVEDRIYLTELYNNKKSAEKLSAFL